MRFLPAPRMDHDSQHAHESCGCPLQTEQGRADRDPNNGADAPRRNGGVRQIAIYFFTQGEDEHTLLNVIDARAKRELLPEFIRLMQDDNWGVRNNAVIALRYYPEQAAVVVPVLVKALRDPAPEVRRLAAAALRKNDPEAAAKAGVK